MQIFGWGSGEYKGECGLDMRSDCLVKGLRALEDDLFEGLAPKNKDSPLRISCEYNMKYLIMRNGERK